MNSVHHEHSIYSSNLLLLPTKKLTLINERIERIARQDSGLTSHALVKEAMRQAEHACQVVGELFGNGPVTAAQPALDVATRKVCDVHDMVVAETQRQERNIAEKMHAAAQLDGYRSKLQVSQKARLLSSCVGLGRRETLAHSPVPAD